MLTLIDFGVLPNLLSIKPQSYGNKHEKQRGCVTMNLTISFFLLQDREEEYLSDHKTPPNYGYGWKASFSFWEMKVAEVLTVVSLHLRTEFLTVHVSNRHRRRVRKRKSEEREIQLPSAKQDFKS